MAQEALAAPGQCLEPSPAPERVLGQIWKPEALSWPERHRWEDGKVDDLDRHLAARAALWGVVRRLVGARRKEFPARVYLAIGDDGSRERAALLSAFGGLPRVEWWQLNGVPAATLEKAVAQLAECFGLAEQTSAVVGASGHLPDSGSIPVEADPPPRFRRHREEPAPW